MAYTSLPISRLISILDEGGIVVFLLKTIRSSFSPPVKSSNSYTKFHHRVFRIFSLHSYVSVFRYRVYGVGSFSCLFVIVGSYASLILERIYTHAFSRPMIWPLPFSTICFLFSPTLEKTFSSVEMIYHFVLNFNCNFVFSLYIQKIFKTHLHLPYFCFFYRWKNMSWIFFFKYFSFIRERIFSRKADG